MILEKPIDPKDIVLYIELIQMLNEYECNCVENGQKSVIGIFGLEYLSILGPYEGQIITGLNGDELLVLFSEKVKKSKLYKRYKNENTNNK